ncbi:hypothetical protein K1T71_010090 [Dendrolimus kikuchii]|uniref:Uncharacterized protein n=1 Tax=Dendrolimus kikuchii TaxID=765133 RepID=A0ACC1CQP3_9NEOP|nr:hypothetical protein K1T71_010090 [Dendrolimus kikuchii]
MELTSSRAKSKDCVSEKDVRTLSGPVDQNSKSPRHGLQQESEGPGHTKFVISVEPIIVRELPRTWLALFMDVM